jgi:hypothetical protein
VEFDLCYELLETYFMIEEHQEGNIKKNYENYRGINLLISANKIYANIIKNKSQTCFKNKLGEEQN